MKWNQARWAKFTLQELTTLEAEACRQGQRQKAEEIRYAITDKLAQKRAAAGDPVPTNGYSGRQSKRRR